MDPDAIQRKINEVDGQIDQANKEKARTTDRHEFAINDAMKHADAAKSQLETNPDAARIVHDFTAKADLERAELQNDQQSYDNDLKGLQDQKDHLQQELKTAQDKQRRNKDIRHIGDAFHILSRDD